MIVVVVLIVEVVIVIIVVEVAVVVIVEIGESGRKRNSGSRGLSSEVSLGRDWQSGWKVWSDGSFGKA